MLHLSFVRLRLWEIDHHPMDNKSNNDENRSLKAICVIPLNFPYQVWSPRDRPSSRQRQSQRGIPVRVPGSRQRKHLPLGEAADTGEERRDRSGTSARPSTTVSRERN